MRLNLFCRFHARLLLSLVLLSGASLVEGVGRAQDPQLHTASPQELGCIKVLLAQGARVEPGESGGVREGV